MSALAAHPDCIGIGITDFSSFYKFELAFRDANGAVKFTTVEIATRDTQLLEQEILSQTHWQVLGLSVWEAEGRLARQIAPHLPLFQNLIHLSVSYREPFGKQALGKPFPVVLKKLAPLEFLRLENTVIEGVEPLPKVKQLILNRLHPAQSMQIVENANPEILTSLLLESSPLDTLPEQLVRFARLERLGLTGNQLTQLPGWIMQLENLKGVSLYANPILKQTELKETTVAKLIKLCTKRKLPQPLRAAFLDLCQNQLPELAVNELLLALSLDIELLNRKAMNELLKKVANPFRAGFDAQKDTMSLIGTLKGLSVAEAMEQLAQHNIKVTDTITAETTRICIGDTLAQKQADEVIKSRLPLALPPHLREFLQRLDTPYLKESDEQTKENILRLLHSRDENNINLAAQLMLTGGIPDELFYCVFLLSFWRGKGYKTHFKTLLEKYTTPEQYNFFKKQQKAGFYKTVDELFKSSMFDVSAIADAGLKAFALPDQERRGGYDSDESFYRPFHHIVKRCFVAGGEPARLAYQAQIQGATLNVLFADDSHFGKFKLPVEILEFEQIERIICAQNVVTEVVTNRKTLKKMKNLKELELYHYRSSSAYGGKSKFEEMQDRITKLRAELPHIQITTQSF